MKTFVPAAAAVLIALLFIIGCIIYYQPQSNISLRIEHDAEHSSIMTGRDSTTDPSDYYELLPGKVLININTADAETLQKLPGIGEALAADIIEYRLQNGPFQKAEDIMLVSGIGESKFSAIEKLISAD